MAYKYSVEQLQQFAATRAITRKDLARLLEAHYPEYYADTKKLRAELKADAEAASVLLRPTRRAKVNAFVISTALVYACFTGGPMDVTGDTKLEDLHLGEYGSERLFSEIESRYNIDFNETEDEFETIDEVVDAILELI